MSARDDSGPAFPQHGWTSDPATLKRMAGRQGLTLRQYLAGQALIGILKEGIVSSAVPSLAKATGKDAEWRTELIAACARSAVEIADAMLAELAK